jgi:hypothetical protein
MAAVVDPLWVLRDQLTVARRENVGFDEAWEPAVGNMLQRVGGPVERRRDEQRAWQDVLDETRPAWARAYDRAPANGSELAFAVAGHGLEEGGAIRPCTVCSGEIPPRRRSTCSEECSRVRKQRQGAAAARTYRAAA